MANLEEIQKIEKKYKKFGKIDDFLTICSRDFGITSYSLIELSRNFKVNINSLRYMFTSRLIKKNRISIDWESFKNGRKE